MTRRPRKWRSEVHYDDSLTLSFPHFLLFLVGMPVKLRRGVIHIRPWLTWGLAGVIAGVSVVAWTVPEFADVVEWLVFRPDASGLAWLSGLIGHVFVHGNWLHLAGNLYFLVLFGRNLECCFGRRRLLGLFFLSAMLGALLHGAVSDLGLIGASGGVFGVLVFYVCQYPHARVIWIPFGWIARGAMLIWARNFIRRGFPVTIYFAIYGGFQLLMLYEQLFLDGRVSALAHLGGGLAGLLIWLAWRRDWLP